ncbi:hypothetical protein N7454_010590 [Penicillium verhagenii]|nr:hypothetical protein N7454_010590 [Penicillium verhagenii]
MAINLRPVTSRWPSDDFDLIAFFDDNSPNPFELASSYHSRFDPLERVQHMRTDSSANLRHLRSPAS